METEKSKAIGKYLRVPPRKARLAAGLIRGLSVTKARGQILVMNLKAGRLLGRVLESAVANAKDKHNLSPEQLVVAEVKVDEGPTLKRAKSKSRGGRVPVMKRTSHFTVVLSPVELNPVGLKTEEQLPHKTQEGGV